MNETSATHRGYGCCTRGEHYERLKSKAKEGKERKGKGGNICKEKRIEMIVLTNLELNLQCMSMCAHVCPTRWCVVSYSLVSNSRSRSDIP